MLESNRIKLRAPEPEDIDTLYRWENNMNLWQFGNTLNPLSKFALKQFIASCSDNIYETKQLRLMIIDKINDNTVGAIDLFDFDVFHNRIAVGIMIDREYQKNGFANESLQLIKEYCFEWLHVAQLFAHIPEKNLPSVALFQKTGFEHVGLMKNWLKLQDGYENVVMMQCLNTDAKF
ncbi:MAG: GNAT family N-acetyltransferase [Bacteroidales bacterium]|nr:GNAT family N-acetyltransferase [Bacteroidales bacterium]